MTRLLLRRAARIFLICLAFAAVLAAWRASVDIRQESQGAQALVRLLAALSDLQSGGAASLQDDLAALEKIQSGEGVRHLSFSIEDGQGQVLVPGRGASLASPAATRLELRRQDGQVFNVTLAPDSHSEQREVLADIAGLVGLFLLYGIAMLAGLYWVVRRAFAPLRTILEAIAGFRQGDFNARLPRLPVSELDQVGGALNHLAEALAAAEARQKQLSLQLMSLQEDERARLAVSLHERLGQTLTALRANLSYLLRRTAGDMGLQAVVRDMEAQATSLNHALRGLLRQLQPAVGEEGGNAPVLLQGMLEELIKSWQDSDCAIQSFQLDVSPTGLRLPRETSLMLYRMTQEALTNSARHAGACRVSVGVHLASCSPSQVHWSVCDDGVGIAEPERSIRLGGGLAGLRERVWALGGQMEIGSLTMGSAGPGLRVAASLPLDFGMGTAWPSIEKATG